MAWNTRPVYGGASAAASGPAVRGDVPGNAAPSRIRQDIGGGGGIGLGIYALNGPLDQRVVVRCTLGAIKLGEGSGVLRDAGLPLYRPAPAGTPAWARELIWPPILGNRDLGYVAPWSPSSAVGSFRVGESAVGPHPRATHPQVEDLSEVPDGGGDRP